MIPGIYFVNVPSVDRAAPKTRTSHCGVRVVLYLRINWVSFYRRFSKQSKMRFAPFFAKKSFARFCPGFEWPQEAGCQACNPFRLQQLANSNISFTCSIPPVKTFPVRLGILAALDKMMFFKFKADKLGIYAFNRAAAPATCGAAIEVPFWGLYPPFKSRLKILVPGAAISTLSNPKFEKLAKV